MVPSRASTRSRPRDLRRSSTRSKPSASRWADRMSCTREAVTDAEFVTSASAVPGRSSSRVTPTGYENIYGFTTNNRINYDQVSPVIECLQNDGASGADIGGGADLLQQLFEMPGRGHPDEQHVALLPRHRMTFLDAGDVLQQ